MQISKYISIYDIFYYSFHFIKGNITPSYIQINQNSFEVQIMYLHNIKKEELYTHSNH